MPADSGTYVRLDAITDYRVLDGPPHSDLLPVVDAAAQIAQVQMATVNVITADEQHQVVAVGFDPGICRREDSMCNVSIEETVPIIVPDARCDPRFQHNPFVTGEIGTVRFYASFQLRTPRGVVIGTLCVFDVEPRLLTAEQERALAKLAEQVMLLLELDLRSRDLAATVEQLQEAQVALSRSNEKLAAFAGQVSHDLRTPLAAVSMSLDLLAETEQADQDLRPVLDRAVNASRRMRALIDDLLEFARLGGTPNWARVDVDEVARDALDDLATVRGGAEVVIGPLPTVRCDQVQLHVLFLNLISNAFKFTPQGQPAQVEISAERRGGFWRIQVVDHGLGVPEKNTLDIFQPFVRAHDAVQGDGIGLANVRRIIDAHGGDVGVAPTPGGGSTFWFELPAA